MPPSMERKQASPVQGGAAASLMRLARRLDFIYAWEIERRVRPFGPHEPGKLTDGMVGAYGAAGLRKHDVLARIARDLPLASASQDAVPALPPGHVHAFRAKVDSAGNFFPQAPFASLSNRMFRVYGPHRFLRVHYDDPLPKHLRLHALTFVGRRYELLYCDLA